ncbi:uncharacterized protein LOC106133683 [Amyelois transitella]|uniref:uncharacterized protein LOC106133683 n=1 Tax=Amyelois transitella TaxID=680683 RepID=UPI00298F40EE|nr:uncharacterized protein LOC106133683 [Amyelois transitella]
MIYRYYNIRTLYKDTIEYDIGYITHQIILRYQLMIETYHIVIKKFVKKPDERALPISPFFYLYTNMIELGQVIVNLANMLAETEAKYRDVTNPLWVDLTSRTRRTTRDYTGSPENLTTVFGQPAVSKGESGEENLQGAQAYQAQLIAEQKRKRKELRKQRKDMQKGIVTPTKGTYPWKKPGFKKLWKYDYGWSIENW